MSKKKKMKYSIEEMKAEKEQKRRQRKFAELDRSRAFMAAWRPIATRYEDSGTPLPKDVWLQVMGKLWEDLEPEGVRGLSVVVRDLLNLRLVCKELNAVGADAFRQLAETCSPREDSELWDNLLSDPMGLTVTQIRKSTGQLRNRVSVLKEVLVVEIFKRLGLRRPISIPARVFLGVREEGLSHSLRKHIRPRGSTLPESLVDIISPLPRRPNRRRLSDFKMRLFCCKEGISNLEQFKRAIDDLKKEH